MNTGSREKRLLKSRQAYFAGHTAARPRGVIGAMRERNNVIEKSAIAVGNLDHAGALRQRRNQRIRSSTVLSVEIGIPFVEQINRRIGMTHDFLQ